ncbi:HIT family protein [Rossellomorea marisflavi]|uniref:HIT family protein n=1 Tax=Rossellomorea marisflavi TaxID=189381 RepID=A0A5D4RRQ3_9BACI|nr:HIT family protein [Rossellomorea marisflavi]TYS52498.1 HIT family protein [Rossellomorea marisflavi]
MDCVICKKHEESQMNIYEDENWIISPGTFDSHLKGYLFMEPKRHIENWTEFKPEELSEVGLLISKIEFGLKKLIDLERLYVLTISEQVRHIHFHLIPRIKIFEKKGISLIEQATQQKDVKEYMNKEEYDRFISEIRNCL